MTADRLITINRTALLVTLRQPYIDWANSFEDGGPKLNIDESNHTAFLLPDSYDEYNYEKWLKKNFKDIFLLEL